jgi:hypothetical protein
VNDRNFKAQDLAKLRTARMPSLEAVSRAQAVHAQRIAKGTLRPRSTQQQKELANESEQMNLKKRI